MLLSRYLAVAASTMALSAAAINLFSPGGISQGGQVLMGAAVGDPDENKVPGDNPLTYCDAAEGYMLDIESVNLTPNPPAAGHGLMIDAVGNLREPVEEGAYVLLQVKYGVITLIKQTVDLCEQVKNVELECPLDGSVHFIKEVELPREIPPGRYTVHAEAYTADDQPIICLQATVMFGLR